MAKSFHYSFIIFKKYFYEVVEASMRAGIETPTLKSILWCANFSPVHFETSGDCFATTVVVQD